MRKEEEAILRKVFNNLLHINPDSESEDDPTLEEFILDIQYKLDQLAHDYTLHAHEGDREAYLKWLDIKLILETLNEGSNSSH